MEERTRTEQNGLITEELRDWMGASTHNTIGTELIMGSYNKLLAIADRIDEQHEHAVMSAMNDALYHANDESMAELGWLRLPKDADGVSIRVGDVVEERSGHTFEVASLMAFGGSDNWLVLSDARNFSSFREPHDLRHHHEPTVEDVLREMLKHFGAIEEVTPEVAEYIAEFAAKLRLAGDGK